MRFRSSISCSKFPPAKGPEGTLDLQSVSLEIGGKQVGITEAFGMLQEGKILKAESLLAKGVPPEVVSTYVNIPVDTVRAIAGGVPTHDILDSPET